MDYGLLLSVVMLCLFGLIMVYDSSVVQSFNIYNDKYFYIKQQLIWTVLGFSSLIFFANFNFERFRKLATPLFGISCALLLAVFIPGLGSAGGGAHRWLRLFGFTIQPTEIVKLTSILYYSYLFEKKSQPKPFFISCFAITMILGIFQKDLGSAIVFFLISLALYLNSGAPIRHFLILIPTTIVGFIAFVATSTYRRQRILAFLDPFVDPQGYSYHISQVLIALGSGGWLGLGWGQSKQKFEYIPEVTTDSIFAVIGEELGFVGATILIVVLGYVVYRGFVIATKAPDRFLSLLAFGLTSWLGIQAVVNLAAMVSLIPLTGVPLPFVSYGGSALLVNLTAVGMLLNISRNS